MISRKSDGEADITVNVDKWTVATEVLPTIFLGRGCKKTMERRWWALDPRYDIENRSFDPDYCVPDRSDLFDNFEDALAYALTMARVDAFRALKVDAL